MFVETKLIWPTENKKNKINVQVLKEDKNAGRLIWGWILDFLAPILVNVNLH